MEEPILCAMISSGRVEIESKSSVEYQNYNNFSFIIKKTIPKFTHKNEIIVKYLNCSYNRNLVREICLKSNCDKFLFLDDDIVLPQNTIKSLSERNLDIVGGWYPMVYDNRWVAGEWKNNNIFQNYLEPENKLTKVDVIGMGCAMITRNVLEKIEFQAGVDEFCYNNIKQKMFIGECGAFGNRAKELGFSLYMDPNVICKHLSRKF